MTARGWRLKTKCQTSGFKYHYAYHFEEGVPAFVEQVGVAASDFLLALVEKVEDDGQDEEDQGGDGDDGDDDGEVTVVKQGLGGQ